MYGAAVHLSRRARRSACLLDCGAINAQLRADEQQLRRKTQGDVAMIALFCLFLTLFASPFESKSRLAASRVVAQMLIFGESHSALSWGAGQVALSCGSRTPN